MCANTGPRHPCQDAAAQMGEIGHVAAARTGYRGASARPKPVRGLYSRKIQHLPRNMVRKPVHGRIFALYLPQSGLSPLGMSRVIGSDGLTWMLHVSPVLRVEECF